MVVIACTPCLASTLGPTALGAATFLGLKESKKRRRRKRRRKKVVVKIRYRKKLRNRVTMNVRKLKKHFQLSCVN